MAKTKKKRTKRYTGAQAARGPVVHRYTAVERGRVRQWIHDHKLRLKIFAILAAVAGALTLLTSGIATLFH